MGLLITRFGVRAPDGLPEKSRGLAQKANPIFWCAGHAQQLGGESPLPNLMEVKG